MTLGLFIGRLNPPHIWHIQIIEKALKENNQVLVLLWSPILSDENNPLNFEQRKELLENKFNNKLIIKEILDTDSDIDWVKSILEKIKNISEKKINFYWWDFKNDSAYLVLKEYENLFKNYKINYIENNRNNSFIEYNKKEYLISATNFRKALNSW